MDDARAMIEDEAGEAPRRKRGRPRLFDDALDAGIRLRLPQDMLDDLAEMQDDLGVHDRATLVRNLLKVAIGRYKATNK